jgi:hypothetical protein
MTHRSLIDWNAVALGGISKSCEPIHLDHQLLEEKREQRTTESHKPDMDYERRLRCRSLFEGLSRYPLPSHKDLWTARDSLVTRCDSCDGPLTWVLSQHLRSSETFETFSRTARPRFDFGGEG